MKEYLKGIFGDYEKKYNADGWLFGAFVIPGILGLCFYVGIGTAAIEAQKEWAWTVLKCTGIGMGILFVLSSLIKYEESRERTAAMLLSTIFAPGFLAVLTAVHIFRGLHLVMKGIFNVHTFMSTGLQSIPARIKSKSKPKKVKKESKTVQTDPYRDAAPSCGECNQPLP